MTITSISPSADVHDRISHPVVDADAHILEYLPLVAEYLREEGANAAADRISKTGNNMRVALRGQSSGSPGNWYDLSDADRRRWRVMRPPWWAQPTKLTVDSATSRLPRLLQQRMEEIGLDYAILYPTFCFGFADIPEENERRAASRGFNRYLADVYGPYRDVMTPAAVIPAHTPGEAIEELEFAVNTLGLKVAVFPGQIRRPIPAIAELHPELSHYATFVDKLALDSEFDYDPLWQKCVELKVAPTFHSGSQNWDSRNSPSNYMYNHIGHFAASSEALCKALFFGGVTRRFPELSFGFLEAGVGWAVNLYADLVGHWEKRNGEDIFNYDPEAVDHALFDELVHQYADGRVLAKAKESGEQSFWGSPDQEDRSRLDEYAAAGIERAEDIRDRFIPNFFFGCEADDRINAWAFNEKINPFGARLRAVFSSDIGHWDVPDMRGVLNEAYELVEGGHITESDFYQFVFANPARLHTRLNKNFFDGTVVETAAATLLADPAEQ
jgi:predicted TIM-barrel fold metal-dependent hydrolase